MPVFAVRLVTVSAFPVGVNIFHYYLITIYYITSSSSIVVAVYRAKFIGSLAKAKDALSFAHNLPF